MAYDRYEKDLEKQCRQMAEAAGCRLFKMAFRGRVGFPDRWLVVPAWPLALGALLEFKRPGKPAAPHQKFVHDDLRKLNLAVGVIDSKEQFKEVLDELLRLARLSEGGR